MKQEGQTDESKEKVIERKREQGVRDKEKTKGIVINIVLLKKILIS
jgi:hypothetical protein